MTRAMEYFSNPLRESCQGLHIQESGEAGLSSNLRHIFSDEYTESAFPVAEKGSFVVPIPKGELDMFEYPGKTEKILPHPSVFRHPAAAKAESLPLCAEQGFIKPSTLDVVDKKYCLPKALLENDLEDTVKLLPGTTAITQEQPDVEVAEVCCFKMYTVGNPTKPKCPPLVPKAQRNNCRWKEASLFYLIAFMQFPGFAGFTGVQLEADQNVTCFTCMDKPKCPKLMTIFDVDDTNVYQREHDSALSNFPRCTGIPSLTRKSCVVCVNQSSVIIICSKDVGGLQGEDSDGAQIDNITSVSCANLRSFDVPQQTPDSGHYGLIGSFDVQLEADQNVTCFTCMDKPKCPKLMTIFDVDDTNVYQREHDSPLSNFPRCTGIPSLTRKSCVVCVNQSSVIIICSNDVGGLQGKDNDGAQIDNITSVSCANLRSFDVPQQTPDSGHYGLIGSFVFLLILGMLYLLSHYKKNRNNVDIDQNEEHHMIEQTTAV